MDWMNEIASESILQQGYAWLCERRRDHSLHGDLRMSAGGERSWRSDH
jgi:hypothetical protein